jgi:hypothetical protein
MNRQTAVAWAPFQSLHRSPDDIVLACMPLREGTDRSCLSRFGEDSWDMMPAIFQTRARYVSGILDFFDIEPVAPTGLHLPRLRALQLCRRRPLACGALVVMAGVRKPLHERTKSASKLHARVPQGHSKSSLRCRRFGVLYGSASCRPLLQKFSRSDDPIARYERSRLGTAIIKA